MASEYIFPKPNDYLRLGIERQQKLQDQYLYFVPFAVNANEEKDKQNTTVKQEKKIIPKDSADTEARALNAGDTTALTNNATTGAGTSSANNTNPSPEQSQSQITRGATPTLTNQGLVIGLPIRPIAVDLIHDYQMSEVFEGGLKASIAQNTVKTMGKNLVNGVVESEGGKLLGLDKLKATLLATSGVQEYKPSRNMYNSTTAGDLTFAWTLSPGSKEEATKIVQITKLFQMFSMIAGPGKVIETGNETISKVVNGGGEGEENRNPWFIKNPAMWSIRVGGNGNLPSHMLKANNEFFPMVCTKVSVKYGSGDALVFIQTAGNKNFPVECSLELTFQYYMNVGYRGDFLGVSSVSDIDKITA